MSAYKGLTAEQMKLVDQFKSRLQALNVEEFKLDSSNFVMRYLKTNKFNLDKAEDNVHEYLMALKKYNAKEVIDAKFPQDFTDQFTTYIGGHDNEGRPIAMIPHGGMWNIKKAIQSGKEELFVRYVLKVAANFERTVLQRDAAYGILICDCSDIHYGNYFHKRTIEVLLSLVNMFDDIAPGIVGKVYFVNAPKMFVALFNTVRSLVTVRADIVAMDSNEKKWRAALSEVIPEDGICEHFGGSLKDYLTV